MITVQEWAFGSRQCNVPPRQNIRKAKRMKVDQAYGTDMWPEVLAQSLLLRNAAGTKGHY